MLQIEYKPITWCYKNIYEQNKKSHDIGAIMESIRRHGFRNPPVYDATLEGIIVGNGRIEAVYNLWLQWKKGTIKEIPQGITVNGDEWAIPVVFGLSAENLEAAIAYLVDDNNLTLMGGDFTAVDTMRMWDDGYLELLENAFGKTVSIEPDDLNLMRQLANMVSDDPLDLSGVGKEPKNFDDDSVFYLRIMFTNEEARDRAKELLDSLAGGSGISPSDYLLDLLSKQ